ncbi:hypothetical protein HYC85_030826 [Camellia sinensis]|uniref:Uncharacterized protein n=1 Tax=Camellia sinensis TaxID=4442 RepID=A0A7J7G2W5_CAMSI|nr:hypothetical protein HYC85_030826 [Camellia sinensis]
MDISMTRPKPTVVTIENKREEIPKEKKVVESESAESGSRDEKAYRGELCVIQGDSLGQGTDDLRAVEEDLANLQFYSDQDPGDAAVNWFDYEESAEATGKAKAHVGTETAVCPGTEHAASIGMEGTASTKTVIPEPDRCLSAADGMWWVDDDLCFAHTDEDWGSNQPDDTWYLGEVDHMTRSGRYFKPPHLDRRRHLGKIRKLRDRKRSKSKKRLY